LLKSQQPEVRSENLEVKSEELAKSMAFEHLNQFLVLTSGCVFQQPANSTGWRLRSNLSSWHEEM
jgi:hypothetical protein